MKKIKIKEQEFELEDKDAALILTLKELITELKRANR